VRLDAADRAQLNRVVSLVSEVLGSDFLAAYLFGSAVLGGLRPDSDLDLLALSRRPTTLDEKGALVERLLEISGRRVPEGTCRRVELTIVVLSELTPWRFPPRFDFQYGDWLRSEFEGGNLEPWPTTENRDLATLLVMVRQYGVPLVGPPAAEIVSPVPEADLCAAMVGDLELLLDDLAPDTRNVLLTFARIWCTLATGEIRSKDEAAAWAHERLPDAQRPALAHARAAYLGKEVDRWEELDDQVQALAEQMLLEIRRVSD
jgi:streptomycin 3"-adenylyltransferase